MKVWLIGAGKMAIEYWKVLEALKIDCEVIGRGMNSSIDFFNSTGKMPLVGGVEKYLENSEYEKPNYVIVAVNISYLSNIVSILEKFQIPNILIEKPGSISRKELLEIQENQKTSNIVIGYNRRFYSSVIKANELLEKDGGLVSLNFEFTEWSSRIIALPHPEEVKRKWFLANSSHVVDLALFFGGRPKEYHTYKSGSLPWHPDGSVFSGAGITENNVLFSYCANWENSGRWRLELLSKKRKYILCPIEILSVQEIDCLVPYEYKDIEYELDKLFKPGIYVQVSKFLDGDFCNFVTVDDMIKNLDYYEQISGEIY